VCPAWAGLQQFVFIGNDASQSLKKIPVAVRVVAVSTSASFTNSCGYPLQVRHLANAPAFTGLSAAIRQPF